MTKDIPMHLVSFAHRFHAERQTSDTTESFRRGMGEPLPGWVGFTATTEDNVDGRRTIVLETRPHITGAVEMTVTVERNAIGKQPSNRRVSVNMKPSALREYAAMLLETADEAEANARAIKPKLV
jgi:hypothetical protein